MYKKLSREKSEYDPLFKVKDFQKNMDNIFNIFWAYEFIEPSVPMREASGYPGSYG